MPPFKRLVNGGWGFDEGGVRYRFFKPSGSKVWRCRAYFDGDQVDEVADTRVQGFEYLKACIQLARERRLRCGCE